MKILSIVFGLIGFVYLSIGLILSFSVYDYSSDPEFNNLSSESKKFIIQNSYLFGSLLTIPDVIAFVATAGLSFRRKIGW